jgi:RimJ/RimL family protein N-acetyltransferase
MLDCAERLRTLFADRGITLPPDASFTWRAVEGQVIGGFAYTNIRADTVELHFVGSDPRWMTRTLLRIVFTYCFHELGVKVILGFIDSERPRAVKVALKLGFKELGVVPGVGLRLLTMVREDCKWLDISS